MARPAVHPTSHRSAWFENADPVHRAAAIDCRFCGQPTGGWHAPFHLDGNHENNEAANLAAACPLCHLPQHLNRPMIEQELAVIWFPELPQAAINLIIRDIDRTALDAGITASDIRQPVVRLPVSLKAHHAAYQALATRTAEAIDHIQTASPRLLGAALQTLPGALTETLPARLSGIRFLPLGRIFVDGIDLYPAILRAWANGETGA